MKDLRNFVGGQWTTAASDRRAELINPSTGEAFATAPVSDAADVDAAFAVRGRAFEGWRDATPSERSLALLRIADTLEARADEFVAAESENTGKPIALTVSEEIPPMVDQIRFFAGAARMLEGTVGRRVHVRLHLDDPARADRRLRPGHARGTTR